ncbi:HlyD family efflux transporter periplasmic adaptor subunit [Pseudobutyrivibrio xylanivorans]|uniref:HlyD family efflux transporter periplasmic adaptor subunit n=1 Tax=Pseudobutyrivibrio xylanivorans TaxID=185007 RepID=A0A5P6VSP5_PSEXY|nr:HlyD family efflux transporter periplasmic adaptor subunit [Pseudobutyrivibrio xylanivorans]QFJ55422.1 HlyD family efflux transporter periplasmic adaptor subunit [Pseudobutyrivibrio xylanivorans]
MSKILRRLLILLVIIGLIVAGLYVGYNYKQGKKVAQVVPLENVAYTNFWGDAIQSYGQVTSEKAQMGYLPKGAEIQSVAVSEGEHVEEGQVILTVKKESKDINNKRLEIQKAEQALKVEQIKMARLENTTPAPEYVYSQDVTKTITYKSAVEYYVKDGENFSYKGEEEFTSGKVAVEYFTPDGKPSQMVIFRKTNATDSEGKAEFHEQTLSAEEDKDLIRTSDKLEPKTLEGSFEYLRSTTYFDYDTGKVVGEINYTLDGEVESERKVPDGMNAKQLAEAIAEEEDAIKKQDINLRKLQYELDTMVNSDDNGQVLATVSGTISKLQTANNFNYNQPFFIITATDNYFISGSIGEFYLDQVNIGDTVSISSWETGNSAEAVITSVSDTPEADGGNFWGGNGNSNSSNYQFKASFDKNAGIEIGSAVDINITPSGQESSGLYIPNYLIKKDAAGSFVMRMNDAGTLEKTYVKIGKSLWGEMTEIKSGITETDCLAFPYGDGAKEGIQCKQVDYFDSVEGGLG